MSYILDALKKSDKERQRGEVPHYTTVHDAVRSKTKRHTLWLYLVPAALLLNAAIFLWWLSPWKPPRPDAKPVHQTAPLDANLPSQQTETAPKEDRHIEQTASNEVPAPPELTRQNSGGPPEIRGSKEKQPAEASAAQQKQAPPASVKDRTKNVASPSEKTQQASAPRTPEASATPDQASAPAIPPPVPSKVYQVSELPEPLRQSLPPFVVSVALYAEEPESRMVRINDYVLREGQFLAPGLRLDQIGRDSLIMSYQNYRFRVGIK